jgi:hypothetical protein
MESVLHMMPHSKEKLPCALKIGVNGGLAWMRMETWSDVLSKPHRVCFQWMHFMAISPVELEIG